MSNDSRISSLEAEGRKRYSDPNAPTMGEAIGKAIAPKLEPYQCVDVAVAMLEDWNYHLLAAVIDAIQHGNGTFNRQDRSVSIVLPEWWG
jgi:hypothetical protein